MKKTIYSILKGTYLVNAGAYKKWRLILFFSSLALIMIASSHSADGKVHQIAKLQEEANVVSSKDNRFYSPLVRNIAKKEGIPVSFTLSDAFVVNTFKESLIDFIQEDVDILFCNDVEALAMTGEEDSLAAFKKLQTIKELKKLKDEIYNQSI